MCDQIALSNSSPNKVPSNKLVKNHPPRPKPSSDQITRKITPNKVLPNKKVPGNPQRELINPQKNKNILET